MILDVARALQLREVVLAFELGEQFRRRLAEHVHQHVEPAAMGHADHDVLDAVHATRLDHVLEQRDQAVAALERETLLRRVARGEVALEALAHRQVPEDVLLLLHGEVLARPPDLEAVLQPQPLVGVRDVRELGADGAAVDVPQLGDQVAQPEARLDRLVAAARDELGVEVGLGEAEIIEPEHLRRRPHQQPERIDVGDQVAAIGVDLDQPGDRTLLRRAFRSRRGRCRDGCSSPWGVSTSLEVRDDGTVRHVRAETAQRREVVTPARLDQFGVRQETVVHLLDVRGIARRERRRGQHGFQFTHRRWTLRIARTSGSVGTRSERPGSLAKSGSGGVEWRPGAGVDPTTCRSGGATGKNFAAGAILGDDSGSACCNMPSRTDGPPGGVGARGFVLPVRS